MLFKVHCGDARTILPPYEGQADLIMTSPPYADARKKHYDSVRLDDFVEWFLTFHEPLWKALKEDGSLVINIKDKVVKGVRHRYVWDTMQALTEKGWHCVDDYIWHKKNSVPGKWPYRLRDAWEYCFHLSKTTKPYMDQEAVKIPIGTWAADGSYAARGDQRINSRSGSCFGANPSHWKDKTYVLPSNVLHLATITRNKGHPAAFPESLPSFFIRLLSRPDSLVIDPFAGSGTTGVAALKMGHRTVLIDTHPSYCATAQSYLEKQI